MRGSLKREIQGLLILWATILVAFLVCFFSKELGKKCNFLWLLTSGLFAVGPIFIFVFWVTSTLNYRREEQMFQKAKEEWEKLPLETRRNFGNGHKRRTRARA